MAGAWRKTLVYLGLVEDDEFEDYPYEEVEMEEPRRTPRRAPETEGRGQREAVVRQMPTSTPQGRVHLVMPTSFNDVQEVGDRFREGNSVVMNLQSVDNDLGRRLVDFASGLAYGIGGSLQPVAEKVFLITPPGVEVSAEERKRFLEERTFYNQA